MFSVCCSRVTVLHTTDLPVCLSPVYFLQRNKIGLTISLLLLLSFYYCLFVNSLYDLRIQLAGKITWRQLMQRYQYLLFTCISFLKVMTITNILWRRLWLPVTVASSSEFCLILTVCLYVTSCNYASTVLLVQRIERMSSFCAATLSDAPLLGVCFGFELILIRHCRPWLPPAPPT